ncbi:MAG: hypothetical protein Q7J57_17115 [Gemmobacter sp.]|nr:hypothetical protein [Gemmobacter sp.]
MTIRRFWLRTAPPKADRVPRLFTMKSEQRQAKAVDKQPGKIARFVSAGFHLFAGPRHMLVSPDRFCRPLGERWTCRRYMNYIGLTVPGSAAPDADTGLLIGWLNRIDLAREPTLPVDTLQRWETRRMMAAQSIGVAHEPMIVLDHLSEAQRRALILADNQIAESAGWDNAVVALELAALRDEHFDLDMIGFDEAELDEFLAGVEFCDAGARGGEGQGGGVADSAHQQVTSWSNRVASRFAIPPFNPRCPQRPVEGSQARLAGYGHSVGPWPRRGRWCLSGRQPDARQRLAQGL